MSLHHSQQHFLRLLLDPLQLDQQINQLVVGHILQISVSNETGPAVVGVDMIDLTADYPGEILVYERTRPDEFGMLLRFGRMWRLDMRITIILAVMLALPSWAQAQLFCSDIDGASVFSSEEAPVYLGFFGSNFATNSIYYTAGTYGASFSDSSVRSSSGKYGNSWGTFSARNTSATRPPKIIRDGIFIAYLSNNTSLPRSVALQTLDNNCQFTASRAADFYTTSAPPAVNPPPPPPQASVESTYSGLWYNPAQDGHGLSISVHSPDNVSVFWYTYDPFGFPIWILGLGQFAGDTIVAEVLYFQGMKFGTWDPAERDMFSWGILEIKFEDCNTARLLYSSDLVYPSGEEFGEGEIALSRIASIDGLECQ